MTKQCDFCGDTGVVWRYLAHDVEMCDVEGPSGRYQQLSRGAWMACEDCHHAIESDNWDRVKDHAVIRFMLSRGGGPLDAETARLVQHALNLAYSAFRSARYGCERLKGGEDGV